MLRPTKPSAEYLKTIALGLKETYEMSAKQIIAYLIQKKGIAGNLTEVSLGGMISDVQLTAR